jgi:hypothetical protein
MALVEDTTEMVVMNHRLGVGAGAEAAVVMVEAEAEAEVGMTVKEGTLNMSIVRLIQTRLIIGLA